MAETHFDPLLLLTRVYNSAGLASRCISQISTFVLPVIHPDALTGTRVPGRWFTRLGAI
jgi:hypothetical protein